MAHQWTREHDLVNDKRDSMAEAANTTTLDVKHGDAQWKIEASSEGYAVGVGYPLVGGQWNVDGQLNWADKVDKDVGEAKVLKAEVSAESPDISGTKTVMNLAFKQEMKPAPSSELADAASPSKDLPQVRFDMCAYNYSNQFQLGTEFEHNTERLQKWNTQLVKQDQNNNYVWLGYNYLDKVVRAGFFKDYAELNYKSVGEVKIDTTMGAKQLMDQPVTLAYGGR